MYGTKNGKGGKAADSQGRISKPKKATKAKTKAAVKKSPMRGMRSK